MRSKDVPTRDLAHTASITGTSSRLSHTQESTVRTSSIDATSTLPTAHQPPLHKPCGHLLHVGSCPQCQRAQLARWADQLTEAAPKNR